MFVKMLMRCGEHVFFLLKLVGLWLFDFVLGGKNSNDLLGYLFVKLGYEFAYETSYPSIPHLSKKTELCLNGR